MKHILLFLALLPAGLTAQDALKLIGVNGKNDIPDKILYNADGSYVVAGTVNNDAALYKFDCRGAVLDSVWKDLSINNSFERFLDVAALPNGEFIAVGYAKAVVAPPANNVNAVLVMRFSAELQELGFDTIHIQGFKGGEAHRILPLANGEWMLCGIQDGAGLDFADVFCVKFNPMTLKPSAAPVIFSYGIDNVRSVDATADGNLIVCGTSVTGNIFVAEALLDHYPFIRKIKPDGTLLWDHVLHYKLKNKFGLTYFDGAWENPATGNILVAGVKTKGDTLENPLDLHYLLLSPTGDSLHGLAFSLPGSQNIYQSQRIGNPPLYGFASVGDSSGVLPATAAARLFFAIVAEAPPGQLISGGHVTDHNVAASLRTFVQTPDGRSASVFSISNPLGGAVHQDWLLITPTIEVSLTYDDPELIAEVNPPGTHQYQWYRNGVAIAGADELTYEITQNGNYSVVVTDDNACSAQAFFLISSTSAALPADIKLFPNPFREHLLLQSEQQQVESLSLSDTDGRVLIRENGPTQNLNIETTNLNPGVYFVQIRTDKGVMSTKVVKH